ncbi:hypothetical protein QR680_008140 [Steinernema hermaphroditum]|uniref:Nuclear receptor domain-containing protein n=1 Tax=Steinernema hermaphroditum TaxID=289476 RepID=A0AA39M7J2_9BILA|nr:hypothetical protein QR680_008140 [Steinernema hermaphroditum]
MSPRVCLVCDDRSDGFHFGVITCRACAAFFRRSISMKKSYRCCKGTKDCNIHKSVRCMCRFCRLNKCIKVGMKIASVQSTRDPLGKRQGSTSTVDGEVENADVYKSMFSSEPSFSNSPATDDESMMPVLYRIRNAYRKFGEERRKLHPPVSAPRPGHLTTTSLVWADEIPFLSSFVEDAFEESRNLPEEQRWLLFRSFYVGFIITESSFRTCQLYDGNDRWILPTNEYIDINDPSLYFHNSCSQYSKEQVSEMLRPSMNLLVRNMVIPLREIGIEELEFAALLGLLFWNRGYEGQSEPCERLTIEIRDRMTMELCYYYKEVLRDPCYALRLSKLLMIIPCVQRMTARFREDAEIGNLFKVYDLGKKISDLIHVSL